MPTNNFVFSSLHSAVPKPPEQGMKKHDFIDDFQQYYVHLLGRDEKCRLPYYACAALSLAIRDRLMERWKVTHQTYKSSDCRRGYYLSMEYLMGRTLSNAMLNLGVTDTASQAM
jgi:starch phosphorylase